MGIRKRPVVFPCYATHQPLFFALYFHIVTNPFSRNPFRFTSIQNQGVGGSLCALSRHSPLPLCFHQLAVSLASPKKSTPLQSSKSGLLFGNTWGEGVPLCDSLCSDLSALCVAPFLYLTCFQQLAASWFLLPLFFAPVSFVFSSLQPLLRKTGGYWGHSD